MSMPPLNEIDHATVSKFVAFIEAAKEIIARKSVESFPEAPLDAFRSFVSQARPLISKEVRSSLVSNRKLILNLSRWLIPTQSDILNVAGFGGMEDPYTNLIAWMLAPDGRPELALKIQKGWLAALGFGDVAASIVRPADPITQFVALDRCRPDMILQFDEPRFVLIVEAKTGSEEHETSDGGWQTESYPAAVRSKLGLADDDRIAMAFLTPDGRQAVSSTAIVTTYQILASAIANSVDPEELPLDLRYGFANVLTHFLAHASPGGHSTVKSLLQIEKFFRVGAVELDDELLFSELPALGPLCRNLMNGVKLC